MGRKRRGQPIHGWLNLDKPAGLSSAAAVAKARRFFDAAKVGHGGTLDPLASGVLPLAFGEATKTVSCVMDGEKTYQFRLMWGEERTTDDAEGSVSATSDHRPDACAIQAALSFFTGAIEQIPPIYSAIKVDGERAYDLARNQGLSPVLKARTVHIHSLTLVEHTHGVFSDFVTACGKGTYIRSLARDLARFLGSCGYIARLRRLSCGPFTVDNAISLEQLNDLGHIRPDTGLLHPIETVLDDIPVLALSEEETHRLRLGQALPVQGAVSEQENQPDQTWLATYLGKAVAFVCIDGGFMRPMRVFNL